MKKIQSICHGLAIVFVNIILLEPWLILANDSKNTIRSNGAENIWNHCENIVEGCALVPPRQFIRTSGGSWAFPGAVFGCLGGILGGLGGVLGPLEGVLVSWGRLESFVGRLGGVLGRLGGVLGAFWWATWFQLGSQNGAQINKKSKPKLLSF